MAAVNDFLTPRDGISAPASKAEAVTPSDTVDLTRATRALYVGVTGDVAVIMLGAGTVTFTAVPAGAVLPIRVTRVKSTGTTATNMVGLS